MRANFLVAAKYFSRVGFLPGINLARVQEIWQKSIKHFFFHILYRLEVDECNDGPILYNLLLLINLISLKWQKTPTLNLSHCLEYCCQPFHVVGQTGPAFVPATAPNPAAVSTCRNNRPVCPETAASSFRGP